MTTPTSVEPAAGPPAMTPERWRAVDAILQKALTCEPERRAAVVADACGDDEHLCLEVASLLAAHVDADDEFLERPAAEAFGGIEPAPLGERLARALAGRYAIDREIARGGMAVVYLARDQRHGRRVAIKVLREELVAALGAERFLAEIHVTATLQHPHILPLFDSGSADGLLWYAMPFVDGETLRSRLVREGPLPVAEAVRLAREVADALDHAHMRGIVHRDVKPENVLLRDGHALVADFGIALALEEAGGERLTRTGLTLGTPQYMAPEQAAGARVLDGRVDVYALGAVLHEMLTGEPPFAAATRQEVVRRMMHEMPPGLTVRRPDVAPFVDAAVRRALAKRPDDRFPSAAAFAAVLAAPLQAGVTPKPVGRTVSARAAMYAAAMMLVVGLAAGKLVDVPSFNQSWSPTPGPPPREAGAPTWPAEAGLSVVDRAGRPVRAIPAERPWTPRFSPDGRSVAYGAFGPGRRSSDLWVTDVEAGTTRRITDDDADANDPHWSADGRSLVYSAAAPGGKDVVLRAAVDGSPRVIATREGTQFPSDWLRDGSALLVTEEAGPNKYDILVQDANGSAATALVATAANETTARISPDGRWVAYTSDKSGRPEVYLMAYSGGGRHVMVSRGGGIHPVWRGDGRELYYWRDGALVAMPMEQGMLGRMPTPGPESELFKAAYHGGVNTMYDVSPDGQRFVIVRQP